MNLILRMQVRYISFILIGIIILAGFRSDKDSYTVSSIRSSYISYLNQFQESISTFSNALISDTSTEQIERAHQETRKTYKRAAYLLNHFDPAVVKLSFNGAPLPVPMQEGYQYVAKEPVGLQVIDEMMTESDLDNQALLELLKQMDNTLNTIIPLEQTRYIDEQQILEAMREQLIRIATLQLTGYDTPGSLSGVLESKFVLEVMLADFKKFSPLLTGKTEIVFKEITALFQASIDFIQNDIAFDTFKRTTFLRDYLNPLSFQLLVFQDMSDISFRHEETRMEKSWNDRSSHLFGETFLNVYAFAGMRPHEDNEHLRKLGAYLFYEPRLSDSQQMSCATCHQPDKAFTDGKQLSISNHLSSSPLRNTPTLLNSVYSKDYFYDLRSHLLRDQVLAVIENPAEFNANSDSLAQVIVQSPGYRKLFEAAFPNKKGGYDRNQISAAISSYVTSLSSFSSTFDRYMRRELDVIDAEVEMGFDLFMGKAACGTCHFAPTFNGLVPPSYDENESEVLGVPNFSMDKIDDDIGRLGSQRKSDDLEHFKHSFKTTTVRNVSVTAPYMHNGIYDTLEELIDFYNNGGGEGMGLSVNYQTLSGDSLHLTSTEQTQLIAFMHSLTDTAITYFKPDTLPRFYEAGQLDSTIRLVDYE